MAELEMRHHLAGDDSVPLSQFVECQLLVALLAQPEVSGNERSHSAHLGTHAGLRRSSLHEGVNDALRTGSIVLW